MNDGLEVAACMIDCALFSIVVNWMDRPSSCTSIPSRVCLVPVASASTERTCEANPVVGRNYSSPYLSVSARMDRPCSEMSLGHRRSAVCRYPCTAAQQF